jgi:hypothetical protein
MLMSIDLLIILPSNRSFTITILVAITMPIMRLITDLKKISTGTLIGMFKRMPIIIFVKNILSP